MNAAQQTPGSGIEISLRLGQRVRHHDHLGQRVTGVVRGISIDSDSVMRAHIVLDTPIVIPARGADDREINIWHQDVPAHELVPFDDRDELVAELLAALIKTVSTVELEFGPNSCNAERALIAKVTGSAS